MITLKDLFELYNFTYTTEDYIKQNEEYYLLKAADFNIHTNADMYNHRHSWDLCMTGTFVF